MNPPNGFSIADFLGNVVPPFPVNGISHFIITDTRSYNITIGHQLIATLTVQNQQSIDLDDNLAHFEF